MNKMGLIEEGSSVGMGVELGINLGLVPREDVEYLERRHLESKGLVWGDSPICSEAVYCTWAQNETVFTNICSQRRSSCGSIRHPLVEDSEEEY